MSHSATNWAIQQRGLKPPAKVVLWHLCDRFNPDFGCFPEQELLAHDCEMSRSSLNDQLKMLEKSGLIYREQRYDSRTKKQKSTRYRFAFEPDFPCPNSGHGPVSENGQKPCPKNAESRVRNSDTNPVREPVREPVRLREGARETDLEEDQGNSEALPAKKRSGLFTKIVQGWFEVSGSTEQAMVVWHRMSDVECLEAADKFKRWMDQWTSTGHTHKVALSTFLREKRWSEVPDAPPEPEQTHHSAKPNGKLWNIWRLRLLLLGPIARMPAPSAYIQGLIDKGGDEGRRWHLRHIALNGYPDVNTMIEQARDRRGYAVPVGFEHLAGRCRQCSTQSPLFQVWQAEHEKRGWPLIDIKGVEWVWLPVPADPDAWPDAAMFVARALEEFEAELNAMGEGSENDDCAA